MIFNKRTGNKLIELLENVLLANVSQPRRPYSKILSTGMYEEKVPL